MIGLPYLMNWQPGLTPVLTILFGAIFFFSLAGFGRIMMGIMKIELVKPWPLACSLLIGVFSFSLINQFLAVFAINNLLSYLVLLIVFSCFGVLELRNYNFNRFRLEPINFVPTFLLLSIFILRLFQAIIPTTKIDELYYHMLLPSRIISDQNLIYYHFPWEGAIWPHMHYQLISPPFYSLGLPDSVNLISLGIFSSLVYISSCLVYRRSKNIGLSLWCAVIFASGLHSIIDYTTNSSNTLLAISSCTSLLILSNPREYLPTKDLKSFSFFFSLLFIGIIGSKISMAPIAIILLIFFVKVVTDFWSLREVKDAILFFSIPIIFFFLPLMIYTWFKSGSPFGPMLSSVFNSSDFIFDPLIASYKGEIGSQENFKEVFFLIATKWSPLVWLSWLLIPHKKINIRTRLTISIVFLIQFFLIWLILPNKPRHFGGIQYCALIICFAECAPYFYSRFKKFSFILLLAFSLPWLVLDLYYASPLIGKSFLKTELFKKDYVPFYNDFVEIDKLIESDAQIVVLGTRVNAFHSPRLIFIKEVDIKDLKKPTYLFAVGKEHKPLMKNFKIGQIIYKNFDANQYCYRTPGKACLKNKLILYKLQPIHRNELKRKK